MTPPAQETSPAAAGGQGAAVGALAASPALLQTVPPVAADAAALKLAQEGAEAIVQGFLRYFARARKGKAQRLYAALRAEAPEQPDDVLRKLVRDEIEREAEFQRKMIERLRRDLPIALRVADPAIRNEKVQAIIARERRYIDAREQAMAERAFGVLSMQALKRVSPDGAFWTLSPLVRSHTLDCVVLSGQFWPWEVLDELHPPLHHGCACELISKQEAIAQGMMTADQVPNTKDAVRRAMRLYQRAKALENAAQPQEVASYLTLVESYDVRYPAGTVKGGQFRPKDGYAPGVRSAIHRALHSLIPRMPETPAQGREAKRGTLRWLAGHRVFVPTHRHFERRFGADTYHSPPGSDIVYRNGDEVTGNDKIAKPLILPGKEDPGTLDRVAAAIDSLAVPTQGKKRPPGDAPLLDHQWRNWSEFVSETHAIGDALGRQFGVPVQHGSVESDPERYDHSGVTDWTGNIQFGADVEPSVLNEAERLYGDNAVSAPDDYELAQTYNTYRVQAHEAAHTVNPASQSQFVAVGGAVLEEGLSEEIAHALLQVNLKRHGRQDVLDWAKAHPRASEVQGTYRKYRAAIKHTFDEMGVPKQDRLGLMLHLKFQAVPSDRIDEMSRIGFHYKGADAPDAQTIASMLTAAYDDRKYVPMIRGSHSLNPRGEPTWPDWKKATPGTRVENWTSGRKGTFVKVGAAGKNSYAVVDWDDVGFGVSRGRVTAPAYDLRVLSDGKVDPLRAADVSRLLTGAGHRRSTWNPSRVRGSGVSTEGFTAEQVDDRTVAIGYQSPPHLEGERSRAARDTGLAGLRQELTARGFDVGTGERRLRPVLLVSPSDKADPGTVPDLQTFGKVFDGFEHGGLTAKVNWDDSEAYTANSWATNLRTVEGGIWAGGKEVGTFRRFFTLDHGVPTVEHDRLRLDHEYRGHGFGTAFNRHAFQEYKQMGVRRVTLHTADVGSYAWARAGFHFTDDPQAAIARLETDNPWATDVPWEKLPADVADNFDAFLKVARSEHEIAGWGRGKYEWTDSNDGQTKMWPGKAFLLYAKYGWKGYLDMNEIQESEMADVFAVWDRMAAAGTLHVTPDDISGDDDEGFWEALT